MHTDKNWPVGVVVDIGYIRLPASVSIIQNRPSLITPQPSVLIGGYSNGHENPPRVALTPP